MNTELIFDWRRCLDPKRVCSVNHAHCCAVCRSGPTSKENVLTVLVIVTCHMSYSKIVSIACVLECAVCHNCFVYISLNKDERLVVTSDKPWYCPLCMQILFPFKHVERDWYIFSAVYGREHDGALFNLTNGYCHLCTYVCIYVTVFIFVWVCLYVYIPISIKIYLRHTPRSVLLYMSTRTIWKLNQAVLRIPIKYSYYIQYHKTGLQHPLPHSTLPIS